MNNESLAVEAIDWFLKIERSEPTLEVLVAWQRWLEQSPAHRMEYEATQRTWRALDHLAPAEEPRAARRNNKWTWGLGLAATVAMTFVAVQALITKDVYQTQVAEHRELILPDRSRVQLGARSIVKIDFSNEHRKVKLLAGEAFFSIAKDATRPFVVDAGVSTVTAIGTAFNVRRYENTVTVEVAEGSVRLGNAASNLKPGQEASMDADGRVMALRTTPLESVAAWRIGRHSYIDEPLSLIVADLNRYSSRRVTIDDPQLANLRITTTFFSDESQGWLHTLGRAVPSLLVMETKDGVRITTK